MARVHLRPRVEDRDDRLAEVLLGGDAELAHPRAVAEGPQARHPLAAEPAVTAELFGCLPFGCLPFGGTGHGRVPLPAPAALPVSFAANGLQDRRISPTATRSESGKTRLGGRTSRPHRSSWARASFTTLTLSAEPPAARRSSNGRISSHTSIAPGWSPVRSAPSRDSDRAGMTLARPEVNPR